MTSIPDHAPLDEGREADTNDAPGWVATVRRASVVGLAIVAAIGFAASYSGLYSRAAEEFPQYIAVALPIMVDGLIGMASLRWIAGVRLGRPVHAWRLTAHVGVAATIYLNALAAGDLGSIPWHVAGPGAWALMVELLAKDVVGDWRAVDTGPVDRIPLRLWLTSWRESWRTSLRMARTGVRSANVARVDADRCAAAREALRMALPGFRARRYRRMLTRRLSAGSLPPGDVLAAIGWSGSDRIGSDPVEAIVRAALVSVLGSDGGSDRTESGSDRIESTPDPVPSPIGSGGGSDPGSGVDSMPGSDRVNGSGPTGSTLDRINGSRKMITARPGDVEKLRAAIAEGALTDTSSIEAIRSHLGISPDYARAARAAHRSTT